MNAHSQPLRYYIKRGLLAFIALFLVLIIILGAITEGAGGEETPAGYRRNEATYISMPDGVQIAADIWYPADLAPSQQVPAILLSTRYWRVQQPGFMSRVLMGLGLIEGVNYSVRDAFNEAGYTYMLIDARGSGASSGTREIEWSPDEIADMEHVVDWIIAQPWSNGAVGGYGISYDGNSAELLAAINHPAVKAVAPLFDRFDPIYNLARPGGVFNEQFISQWGEANATRDQGHLCPDDQQLNPNCLLLRLLVGPLKPVDSDGDGKQLEQILADRDNSFDVYRVVQALTYREDELAPGLTAADISPFGLRQEIERPGIPLFIQTSWFDAASVNGTLSRYMTFSNPQQVIIGPWSHGGDEEQKLNIPSLRQSPVSRPQPMQLLDAGRNGLFTRFSAPAGFGKTTLISGTRLFMVLDDNQHMQSDAIHFRLRISDGLGHAEAAVPAFYFGIEAEYAM